MKTKHRWRPATLPRGGQMLAPCSHQAMECGARKFRISAIVRPDVFPCHHGAGPGPHHISAAVRTGRRGPECQSWAGQFES